MPPPSACVDCSANCAVCTFPSVCRTCDPGYDLRNGTCVEREILVRWRPLATRFSTTFKGSIFTAYGAADDGVLMTGSALVGKRTNAGATWSVDPKYNFLECQAGWAGTPLVENYIQWQVGARGRLPRYSVVL